MQSLAPCILRHGALKLLHLAVELCDSKALFAGWISTKSDSQHSFSFGRGIHAVASRASVGPLPWTTILVIALSCRDHCRARSGSNIKVSLSSARTSLHSVCIRAWLLRLTSIIPKLGSSNKESEFSR